MVAAALVIGTVRVLPRGAEESSYAPPAVRAFVSVPALLVGAWGFIQGIL